MKPLNFLNPLLMLLLHSEAFPVRVMASRDGFPQGEAPHCHNGFELRMVPGSGPETVARLDLIHPEVCHCNMPRAEWEHSWILFLRGNEAQIAHGAGRRFALRSPELPAFLEFLSGFPEASDEAFRLDLRLRLALIVLHAELLDEPREGGRIAWMAEYLRRHYYDHRLSIAELSRQAGCSPNYVQQLFRKETGMTPKAYLRNVRMEAAARFLGERRYLVKEIALLCGFADAHFFATAFRKHYGCPPTEYAAAEQEVRR